MVRKDCGVYPSQGWFIWTTCFYNTNIKPDFCKACEKAKAAWQPLSKESLTCATTYRKHVHWDLWDLASVQSINGNHYVAAQIDDATHETKLYFQKNKFKMFKSYL